MTAARQEMNERRAKEAKPQRIFGPFAGLAMVLAGAFVLTSSAAGIAQATTTERVVVDHLSGLAIAGFDPVGYFTEARPVPGLVANEAHHDGAIWRFRNEGNRAAFLAHPDIYAPRFGGFDPVDVARGKTVASYPQFWMIVGNKLYLFASEANRVAFAAEPARYADSAERRWPSLRETLAQ